MNFLYNYYVTLTQAAGLTKKFILISSVLSMLGIISFTGYKIWHAQYLASLPPVEEKPDMKFGALPVLNLPKSNVSSSNFSYSLDTTTGNLPNFPKIARVFFMPKTQTGFLAPDKAQELANKFDLKISPEILSETKYKFKDQARSLLIDLDSGNFTYQQEATATALQALDSEDKKLIDNFKNLLSAKISLPEEIKTGISKLQRSSDNLTSQISLWPQTVDEKPIVTTTFIDFLINAKLTGQGSNLNDYLSLNYIYWPIDQTTYSTYPIKSADTAFNELQSGQGAIVIEPPKPQVSITSIYLGYYEDQNYQTFLQPVVVFEGVNFVAYVDAIAR